MAFGTVEFDLSMVNPETGRYLTANIYTVDGVTNADGSLRTLSIGQLVMAICLQRAAQLETDIVALMEEMNSTSLKLERMTELENSVLDHGYGANTIEWETTYNGRTYTWHDFLVQVVGMNSSDVSYTSMNAEQKQAFMTVLESKMDEMNSFSQQKMIELQSLTNKRDQSYDMISNILKSLNTVLVGNANNM